MRILVPFIYLLIFTGNLILTGCDTLSRNQKRLDGRFISWWGSTHWSYTFDSLGTYEFSAKGHCCFSTTKGTYQISNNIIYLTPLPKVQQPDSAYFSGADTLLLESDYCLLDVPSGYEFKPDVTALTILYESKRRDLSKKGYPISE